MKKKDKKRIKKIKKDVKKQILPIVVLLGLVIILIAVFGVTSWQIYNIKSETRLATLIAKIIPLPAAVVNGEYISYNDYLKTLNAAKNFYNKQKDAGYDNVPPVEETKKMVMEERLIKNELIKQIAYDYKINVSQDEINTMINGIIASQGSQQEFEDFLEEFYLMSLADYKRFFIIPGLYADKLNQQIVDDESLNSQSKTDIQAYLSSLRNGQSFEDLLKEGKNNILTQDIVRGVLPIDIESQLFDLSEGQYTDILTLPHSFQIIRINKKDLTRGVVTISSLVVPIINLDNIIEQKRTNSKINIYIY